MGKHTETPVMYVGLLIIFVMPVYKPDENKFYRNLGINVFKLCLVNDQTLQNSSSFTNSQSLLN